MREVDIDSSVRASGAASFAACLATILELRFDEVPLVPPNEEIAGWRTLRWLGGLGLGLIAVADAASFRWAGPWIGWVRPAGGGESRAVVMFGVPSGIVWDPTRSTEGEGWQLEAGFVVAALDVALARPARPDAPTEVGTLESIWVAAAAGKPGRELTMVRARAGCGLEGDRHVAGAGTFPSGMPGSALTMIEAEVCESFDPPLDAAEHRRNLVTRGIDLNRLVGHEFRIGQVRCRGMRLNEPCSVIQGYSTRPILRPLVHRGGLRADILDDGIMRVGDPISVITASQRL